MIVIWHEQSDKVDELEDVDTKKGALQVAL